jgi:hypothetical protein
MPWYVAERHYKGLLGLTTLFGVVIFATGSMVIMDFQTWAGVPLVILGIAIAMLPMSNLIHVRPDIGGEAVPGSKMALSGDGTLRVKGDGPAPEGNTKFARKVRNP